MLADKGDALDRQSARRCRPCVPTRPVRRPARRPMSTVDGRSGLGVPREDAFRLRNIMRMPAMSRPSSSNRALSSQSFRCAVTELVTVS
jgi:hypothetical protein